MGVKFADFISDPAVCREAEEYWRQLFAKLPCRPLEHGWTEWGTTTYLDEDGGNIFAAKDDAARRGIVIVMCREIDTRTQVVAWTGWFGGDADDPESIAYIKINLVHTDATENIALTLLTRFVCGGASLQEIDALISEMGLEEQAQQP
jgi:hypothetical protein